MIDFKMFVAGVYMVVSPAPLLLGIILCTKKKKANNSVSSVKPQEAITTVVVGDRKMDGGEDDRDLASRLQSHESTPAGDSMQPADAPPDATGELVSVINSVVPPAAAPSPKKKDNSVASTILLSISKQLCMAPSDVKAAVHPQHACLRQEEEHTQCMSEGKQKSKQMLYVTGSSELQSKKLIREQDKTQNTENEQKQLDEESTPISSGVISTEDTPPSIAPLLKVNQMNGANKSVIGKQSIRQNSTGKSLSQNSASSAKGDVEEKCDHESKSFLPTSAEDIMSKLDLTQASSTISSEDDECKKSSGQNNNNNVVKMAARGSAKGTEERRYLRKCRGSAQNDFKPLPDNNKNVTDGSGQETSVEGILQEDETESAEISCSPVMGTQSDENTTSEHSWRTDTKKTKVKIYDEHKGRLPQRKMTAQRKMKVEITSESESRKVEGLQKNSQTWKKRNNQGECSEDDKIAERRKHVCTSSISNRKKMIDVMQQSNPKSLKSQVSKQINATAQSDLVVKQFTNVDDNSAIDSTSGKLGETRGPSSETVIYPRNAGERRERMSIRKPRNRRRSTPPL